MTTSSDGERLARLEAQTSNILDLVRNAATAADIATLRTDLANFRDRTASLEGDLRHLRDAVGGLQLARAEESGRRLGIMAAVGALSTAGGALGAASLPALLNAILGGG